MNKLDYYFEKFYESLFVDEFDNNELEGEFLYFVETLFAAYIRNAFYGKLLEKLYVHYPDIVTKVDVVALLYVKG